MTVWLRGESLRTGKRIMWWQVSGDKIEKSDVDTACMVMRRKYGVQATFVVVPPCTTLDVDIDVKEDQYMLPLCIAVGADSDVMVCPVCGEQVDDWNVDRQGTDITWVAEPCGCTGKYEDLL